MVYLVTNFERGAKYKKMERADIWRPFIAFKKSSIDRVNRNLHNQLDEFESRVCVHQRLNISSRC